MSVTEMIREPKSFLSLGNVLPLINIMQTMRSHIARAHNFKVSESSNKRVQKPASSICCFCLIWPQNIIYIHINVAIYNLWSLYSKLTPAGVNTGVVIKSSSAITIGILLIFFLDPPFPISKTKDLGQMFSRYLLVEIIYNLVIYTSPNHL